MLLNRFFALLHFRFDELFDLLDLEKAIGVLELVDDGAVGFGEDDDREFFAGEKLLSQ